MGSRRIRSDVLLSLIQKVTKIVLRQRPRAGGDGTFVSPGITKSSHRRCRNFQFKVYFSTLIVFSPIHSRKRGHGQSLGPKIDIQQDGNFIRLR